MVNQPALHFFGVTSRNAPCTFSRHAFRNLNRSGSRGTEVNPSTSITLEGMVRGCLQCDLVLVDERDAVRPLNGMASAWFPRGNGAPHSLSSLPPDVIDLVRRSRETGAAQQLSPRAESGEDGLRSPFHLEALPLPGASGQPGVLLVLLGTAQDHPLEMRLKHFERLARLGTLSAGIAHELRNALVPLTSMAELLLQRETDAQFAQTVRHELQRANDLAAQMLKYSRPRQTTHVTLSLHRVIERALALVRSRIKETAAQVELRLEATPDTLWGDEAHLEQVFVNLLLNATEALGHEGRIIVETRRDDNRSSAPGLMALITDNGGGIGPEDQPNLFHPFFTTKRHGTGLGLYLARRIVTEHRGEIVLTSAPAQGTSVRVMLPVDAPRD